MMVMMMLMMLISDGSDDDDDGDDGNDWSNDRYDVGNKNYNGSNYIKNIASRKKT